MEVRSELLSVQKHAARRAIQPERPDLVGRRFGVQRFAPQMGLHARDQLARAEGLGHVVVAADFERPARGPLHPTAP